MVTNKTLSFFKLFAKFVIIFMLIRNIHKMLNYKDFYILSMNMRIFNDTSLIGEGIKWVIAENSLEEAAVSKEEVRLNADIKKLFYPETSFMAPGMDRKNSEEEEEIDSCESEEDLEEGSDIFMGTSL